MRSAPLTEPRGAALQHEAHRGRHATQFNKLPPRQRARIDMGQQPRLVQDALGNVGYIINRAVESGG